MPRGRKPKPTAIKKVQGNPGKRPINDKEPQAPDVKNIKPPWGRLPKHARRLWNDLAPLLDQMGVLKETDLAALELLCQHYGFALDAAQTLRDEGITVTEPAGVQKDKDGNATVVAWRTKKNPAAQIFRENSVAFRLLAGEFGLTPSSRARLDVDPEDEKSLAELLFDMSNNG